MSRHGLVQMAIVIAGLVTALPVRAQVLTVDLKADYVTRYIWRGFDLFQNRPGVQPSVTLSDAATGLFASAWGS